MQHLTPSPPPPQDITGRLAEALAAIPKFNLHMAEDVNEDVEHLQNQLGRLKYRVGAGGGGGTGWGMLGGGEMFPV